MDNRILDQIFWKEQLIDVFLSHMSPDRIKGGAVRRGEGKNSLLHIATKILELPLYLFPGKIFLKMFSLAGVFSQTSEDALVPIDPFLRPWKSLNIYVCTLKDISPSCENKMRNDFQKK